MDRGQFFVTILVIIFLVVFGILFFMLALKEPGLKRPLTDLPTHGNRHWYADTNDDVGFRIDFRASGGAGAGHSAPQSQYSQTSVTPRLPEQE